MTFARRSVYFNDAAGKESCAAVNSSGPIAFHRSLPNYSPTPLIALPDIAAELGLRGVFVKDESSRFGLPSFKILGASWGIVRALSDVLGLPVNTPLEELSVTAKTIPFRLFAATDGNHGRAVALMAKMLSLEAHIFVPAMLDRHTCDLIAGEGATIHVVAGDYDLTVQKASAMSNVTPGGVLIQDTAFPGYEQIPSWIVEGYSTMLHEIDQQLSDCGICSTMMITPVGVGSLAHAVVKHCKSGSKPVSVVTVEPDTAACLYESLKSGTVVSLDTSPTIMSGMNCGTVSLTAWGTLRRFVDASTTISCFESHSAVKNLAEHGVQAGPCGAASLAALKLIASMNQKTLNLDKDSLVVLLSTEGTRPYKIPLDVSTKDPVVLSQILTKINSQRPEHSEINEKDENETTDYIIAWFEHNGIKYKLVSTTVTAVGIDGIEYSITLPSKEKPNDMGANTILAKTMVSMLTPKTINI